jgi:FKBP-type peptidyl-prolyl cis-trans isomerase SlyD
MTIVSPCVVALTWTLHDAQEALIDDLTEPTEFLVGGSDLLPAIEAAIVGQSAGFETRIQLEPEQAFGEYDPSLVFFEPRHIFPKELAVGLQFDGIPPGAKTPGLRNDAIYTVTEIYPEHVVLDGNHPLAGIALRLSLKVHVVRPASAEEIEAGSVGEPVFSVLGGAPDDVALH